MKKQDTARVHSISRFPPAARRAFLGLALAAALLVVLGSANDGAPQTPVAKIERVSDGDTVTAITSNQTKRRLRLLGIDAPEVAHGAKLGQPYGEEPETTSIT